MVASSRRPGGTSGTSRRAPGTRPAQTRPSTHGRTAPARARKSAGPREEGRRPPEGSGSTGNEPLLRIKGSTRRLAILGAVVVLLISMLLPTVQAWFAQRAELDSLRAKVAGQEESVRSLEQERERWKDSAYIEQQARQRLKFVRPGEVAYTVVGSDKSAGSSAGQLRGSVVAPANDERMAWYTQMWTSLELTDGLGRGSTRLDGPSTPPPSLSPTTTPVQQPSSPPSVPVQGTGR